MLRGFSMQLNQIVVATDDSGVGRNAVRVAYALARRAGARLTVMTAVPSEGRVPAGAGELPEHVTNGLAVSLERLKRAVEAELGEGAGSVKSPVEVGVAYGIPGIEIGRFAEGRGADLVVLGRKQRSQTARLLLGDTADAVARRSRIPCLLVPMGVSAIESIVVALDGTERGMAVLRVAGDFARAAGIPARLVTVDPVWPDERLASVEVVATARTARLAELLATPSMRAAPRATLDVRHGDTVDELLRVMEESRADVLAIGYHRGGPPGVVEAGSIARRLAHTAPGAVLTVPL